LPSKKLIFDLARCQNALYTNTDKLTHTLRYTNITATILIHKAEIF